MQLPVSGLHSVEITVKVAGQRIDKQLISLVIRCNFGEIIPFFGRIWFTSAQQSLLIRRMTTDGRLPLDGARTQKFFIARPRCFRSSADGTIQVESFSCSINQLNFLAIDARNVNWFSLWRFLIVGLNHSIWTRKDRALHCGHSNWALNLIQWIG